MNQAQPSESLSPSEAIASVSEQAQRLIRESAVAALVLTTITALITWLVDRPDLAVGLTAGALFAALSFLFSIKAIHRAIANAITQGDSPSSKPALSGSDEEEKIGRQAALISVYPPIRLAFMILALLGILRYMPARPEGVAAGYGLFLIIAVFVARRNMKKLKSGANATESNSPR